MEGGGAAIGLLTSVDWRWFVLPPSLILLALLAIGRYEQVERALKYLLLGLCMYAPAAAFTSPRWGAVIRGSLVPHFRWTGEYTADAISLIGTTLTSYVFVWQTALRPLAGDVAGDLFAVALLASAVVALSVLTATTAYVSGAEARGKRGLSLRLTDAPLFYGALTTAALLGAGIALGGISPIRLPFIAGIIAGIAAPIGLCLLLAVAGNRSLMHDGPVARPLLMAGWAVTAIVTLSSLIFVIEPLAPSL